MAVQQIEAIQVRTPVHKRPICGKPEGDESLVLSRVLADYWQGSRKFRNRSRRDELLFSGLPFARLTDEEWLLFDEIPQFIIERCANKLQGRWSIPWQRAYTIMHRFITK